MKNLCRAAFVGAAASLLQGCWFIFIPGPVIDAAADVVTGDEGDHCVSSASQVGDSIQLPDGQTYIVQSISGRSWRRCKNKLHPVRAFLVPPNLYKPPTQIDTASKSELDNPSIARDSQPPDEVRKDVKDVCIAETAKVGDVIAVGSGSKPYVVSKLRGRSTSCKAPHPIRASLTAAINGNSTPENAQPKPDPAAQPKRGSAAQPRVLLLSNATSQEAVGQAVRLALAGRKWHIDKQYLGLVEASLPHAGGVSRLSITYDASSASLTDVGNESDNSRMSRWIENLAKDIPAHLARSGSVSHQPSAPQPVTAPAPSRGPAQDPAARLQKLEDLRKKGLITDQEYRSMRAEILRGV